MNDDLLIEILTRLPLKSLFRFKCVSKRWCRLVSDDYLRRRLPLITSAIFYRCDVDADEPRYACSSSSSDGGLDDCSLSFFPFRQISTIVDCCNGLILCYSTSLSEFHVLNPATKRWSNIPKPLKRTHRSILAFDPSRSSEFKVISFTGWLADGAELEVFASETGNWVEHEVCWGLNSDAMLSTTICFFGDTLYIIAYPKYVVGVDLTDMTCRMTELPESMEPGGRIGQCDGALCYTHRDGDQLKFWTLRDSNGSNWVLKSAISTKLMVERSLKTSHYSSSSTSFALPVQLKFLAFHPQREVVYLWLPGKIISYDLSKNSLEEAYKFRNEMETAYFFQIWLFPFSCYMSDCLVKI